MTDDPEVVTRLVTDQNTNVVSRHDYLPFGEEIPAGSIGRSTQYGALDAVEQKFTGQQRDEESQLDYFNARYYGGALGRFTSPDPRNAGADLFHPQSWNGYSYVGNNPLAFVDPSGESLADVFATLWNGINGITGDIANWLNPPCGATFCITGTSVGDVGTVSAGGGGGLSNGGSSGASGGGGAGDGGASGGSGVKFVTTVFGQSPSSPPGKNEVPENVCKFAGNAMDPSFWASAGTASKWNSVSAILDLTKGFKIGGYLDTQPMAAGNFYQRAAYGNYVFGVWMRASGTPLPIALAGANEIAFVHKVSSPNQYRGRQMDSFFWSLPAANVINIVNGYNAQENGMLCHK